MQKDVGKFGFSDKRGRTPTSDDPYQAEAGGREPALCPVCQAVYRHKSWQSDEQEAARLAADPVTPRVTCPACRKVAGHYPEGILTLRGSYLWQHEEEIRHLLDHAVEEAAARKPLERILSVQRLGDELVIETTDHKLAEQLGRLVQKAHSGDLKIDWQGDPVVCRAQWERGE